MSRICLKNLYNLPDDFDYILGPKTNIDNFSTKDLKEYYDTYYTPDNCTTYIIGDVDTNEAINLVSKYFNKSPNYSKINKRTTPIYTPITTPKRQDFISKTNTSSSCQIAFALNDNLSLRDYKNIKTACYLLEKENSSLHKRPDDINADFLLAINNLNDNQKQKAYMLNAYIDCEEEKTEEAIKIFYEEFLKAING